MISGLVISLMNHDFGFGDSASKIVHGIDGFVDLGFKIQDFGDENVWSRVPGSEFRVEVAPVAWRRDSVPGYS